ncbi:hypothetical protein [Paraburkholderia humisilvae]|uniref:Uncharacterized protein n=1 Tax=Paraburkholderia humisilvae TaxID=627669 RepID=A0A6J5EGR6_9BURK|nr:hypothetical protein [Paraburkholderia humisilvae]CAB3764225.1 hypothetical protein LMG29542_04820 [Paraburkholderia humisilvae]
MKKRTGESTVLPGQLRLDFDVFAIEAPKGIVAAVGESELDAGIRQAFGSLLERAFAKGQSRDRLADALTTLLGRPVGKAQLDQWAAPSQSDRRVPVDVWMALMKVADDYAPLEWMAIHARRRVLTIDEAVCAEFGAMAVLESHLRARKRSLEGRMDGKLLEQIVERIHSRNGK